MSEQPATAVTWNEVKRLFHGIDIAYMKMLDYHLDDPVFVARNFKVLLSRLQDGSMPPRPFEPWDRSKLETLEAWKAAGFPLSPTDIEPDLASFIALSEFLTGFDDLRDDPLLADEYLQRLRTRPPGKEGGVSQASLRALIEGFDPADPEAFERDVLPQHEKAARTVILLWYTASFINLESGFTAGTESTGADQYPSGLVWRAILAHPMGYAAEGYSDENGKYGLDGKARPYWVYEPREDGRHTGLGPGSIEP
jgi:hypothetical protein